MSKRKAYARVVVSFEAGLAEPIEVIAGVELNPAMTMRSQYDLIRKTVVNALSPSALRNFADDTINTLVEDAILHTFGDQRSYFIEVGRGKMDEYVQVFLP